MLLFNSEKIIMINCSGCSINKIKYKYLIMLAINLKYYLKK